MTLLTQAHVLCLETKGPISVTRALTCIWDPMTVLLQASSVLLIVSSMAVLPTYSLLEFRWRSSKFWTSALYWLVKASSYWSVHSRIRFSQPSAVFSSKAWASEGEFCKQPRVNGSRTTGKTCPQCSERYERAIKKGTSIPNSVSISYEDTSFQNLHPPGLFTLATLRNLQRTLCRTKTSWESVLGTATYKKTKLTHGQKKFSKSVWKKKDLKRNRTHKDKKISRRLVLQSTHSHPT